MDPAIIVDNELFYLFKGQGVSATPYYTEHMWYTVLLFREAGRALKILEVESSCDPGSWDCRQVAIWMESHSVSLCVLCITVPLVREGSLQCSC